MTPLPDIVARLLKACNATTDEERDHVVRVATEVHRATTTTDEENHDD